MAEQPDRSKQMILAIVAVLGVALAAYAWFRFMTP